MTLRVSGKNLDIGDSLRQHVLEKVEAMVARYFDGYVGGHVVISREGSGYRTDCSLHLSSGMNLQAEGRAHEPYACFDQAADKIERRLRRYKKRLKGHLAGTASERGKVANFSSSRRTRTRKSRRAASIRWSSRKGRKPLKTLSVASAVAELDLTGAPRRRLPARRQRAREYCLPASRRRDRLAGSPWPPAQSAVRRLTRTIMSLSQLLNPDAVIAALRVNGKKQALQELSERAAEVSGLPAREIFDAILQRERLGPTGVGDGIAIPHGKLPQMRAHLRRVRAARAADRLRGAGRLCRSTSSFC